LSLDAAVFAVSVVGLFLELLLVRWVTTEIRIFAYLQNTVLVVCFLGLGMGCWDSKKAFRLRHVLVPLLILVAVLALPPTRILLGGTITDLLSGATGHFIWGGVELSGGMALAAGIAGVGLTFGMLWLLWAVFVPVGRQLGRLMADHPKTLRAYSVNVAGSLIGIWLFVACSGLSLAPVWWFAVFAIGGLFLTAGAWAQRAIDAGLLAAVVAFGVLAGEEPGWKECRWSPYQKLCLFEQNNTNPPSIWAGLYGERRPFGDLGTHVIAVNNVGYQAPIDLRPEVVTAKPDHYVPTQRGYSQYDLPPKLHPNPKKGLVVGAGSGNDVAGLLRNGVTEVVAVEIDPVIIEYGKQVHPEKPYDHPGVRVVNDDARSFFATTTEKFDVIAFGLLDSHTTTAMTNARLDHYVYTRESIAHAKTLLNPGGVLVLSFEAQKPFVVSRMSQVLEEQFGRPPLAFRMPANGYGWGGVLFVTGDEEAVKGRLAADPKLAEFISEWSKEMPAAVAAEVATDDWPYIYLEGRSIPPLYLLLAGCLLGLFVLGVRSLALGTAFRGWGKSHTHFALLGAGFMLLEVQNISKASVVLGNTWVVNAVVITGVLMMILAANALSPLAKKLPPWVVYGCLLGSCVGLYFVDLSRFGFLPYWQKATAVGLLTSLPMLFSGLIFARSFTATPHKDAALGANLFGSLLGALVQSVTFVTGIKALLLLVAAFYLAAILTRPKDTTAS
jgi:spermidine synthase